MRGRRQWGHSLRTGVLAAIMAGVLVCGGGCNADHEPAPVPAIAADATTFELLRGGVNQFLIPVQIGGQTLNLLVDTGSNALLVFADRLKPDNTAVQPSATSVSKAYSSTVRRGRLALAPVRIGAYACEAMRIMLVDSPQSWNDPSLTAKHADGVIGLRRTEGLTQRLDSVPLDVPLAALQPAISAFELDLPASGRATLSFGTMPTLDRVGQEFLFAAKTHSITDTIDKIHHSYSDLQIPFRVRSRLGSADGANLDILLDTGATSKLVLDTAVATALGYDPRSGRWKLTGTEEIELNLVGPHGSIPLLPKFKVNEIKVTPLSTQGVEFEAVLGIDRWQGYIVGFSSVDYQAGGPDGTITILDRRELGSALAAAVPRSTHYYVELPGLNSLGDDCYASADDSGQTIVFQSNRTGGQGGWDVYVYRQGQGLLELPELNSAADDSDPTISGDGRLLAFHSNRPGSTGDFDIFLFDLQTRTFIPLPQLNTSFLERTPSFSRDGRYLAFRSEGRPGTQGLSDVFLYDLQLGQLVPLPGLNTAQDQFDPAVSGDGRYLAIENRMARTPSDGDICLYDVVAGAVVPLSSGLYTPRGDGINSPLEEEAPAISADGQWLAFHSNRSDPLMGLYNRDLVVAQVASGLVVKVPGLNSEFDEAGPNFSGDGSKVVFHSSRPDSIGGSDIYMFDLGAAMTGTVSPVTLPPQQLPLAHLADGRFALSALVGGTAQSLLLDTGSSMVVLFSDRLPNTAYTLLGESVSVQLPGGVLVGELARIDLQLDGRQAPGMTCVLAQSGAYPDSAAAVPATVAGVFGLRFKRAVGEVTGNGVLDVPLAALQPAVSLLELDLAASGPAGISLGALPVIGALPSEVLFNSYVQGTVSQSNALQQSFTDLEPRFLAQSSLGLKSFEPHTLILSSVLTERILLDQRVAIRLGYDPVLHDWQGAEWVDLHLVGTSSVMLQAIRCPVSHIEVRDLAAQDYAAVLNLERWQDYVVGFDFVDYQAGGQDGVASFIARSDVRDELLLREEEADVHFVPLPGLNSLGDDAYGDLSDNGQVIAFQSNRLAGAGRRDVLIYDVGRGLRAVPGLNSAADDGDPSLSGDGRLVAFHSDRSGDFDIYLYDLVAQQYIALPGLNSSGIERNPDLSADGRRIAFRSERPASRCGTSDIYLYDIPTASFVALSDPWMNTCAEEYDPSLNADGRLLSFNAPLRDDGQGVNDDVYLYDVTQKDLRDLRFASSAVLDAASSLSSDGNFMAFGSERNRPELASRGRDVFLLDLRSSEFVFLPGLNCDFEDSAPVLTENAHYILFHSKRPGGLGGYDLYLYHRD